VTAVPKALRCAWQGTSWPPATDVQVRFPAEETSLFLAHCSAGFVLATALC
jgi:hypothetical protein